ncbi:DUF2063 domain-containing protein [Acidithiobacillus ferriphilus]|nr:DUF2063 domain-containing protein [Acidithiobacillus ferriphilus]
MCAQCRKLVAQPESGSDRALTTALAAHLRAPADQNCPADFDFQAAELYRELLVGNFAAALQACFPLWIRAMGEAQWLAWRDAFIAEHACRSPFFRQIPDEFLAYLSARQADLAATLPYALELAHLEWLELTLGIAETDLPPQCDPDGDPWTSTAILNPVHALLQYRYPVQRLILDPSFTTAPGLAPEPSPLFLYRDAEDVVQMIVLDALGLRLFATLRETPMPGATLFAQWQECGLLEQATDLRSLEASIRVFLQRMRSAGAILGTIPTPP